MVKSLYNTVPYQYYMIRQNKTGKGSNEKNHIFEVGDIVKIVPNHRPFSRNITRKYPHGKELINQVCFVEQILGDRYSLYALEKPAKPRLRLDKPYWYIGDILESCLEPCSIKCEDCNDLINKMPLEAIKEYKHFIYETDTNKILSEMREQQLWDLR